jgi:hypothetical protein
VLRPDPTMSSRKGVLTVTPAGAPDERLDPG